MIEPSRSASSAANAAWLAWEWRRDFSWAFIFSTAFFQLVNGLVTHTPPVRWSDFPDFLQTLQKAPLQSSSYSSQEKSFFPFRIKFPAACCGMMLCTFLRWGGCTQSHCAGALLLGRTNFQLQTLNFRLIFWVTTAAISSWYISTYGLKMHQKRSQRV